MRCMGGPLIITSTQVHWPPVLTDISEMRIAYNNNNNIISRLVWLFIYSPCSLWSRSYAGSIQIWNKTTSERSPCVGRRYSSRTYDSSYWINFVCVVSGSGEKNKAIPPLFCIGCGTGNHLIALSEYVGKVTGLDLNEGMLKKALEKTAHIENVQVMHGDITNMPYPDGQFDAICCNVVSISIANHC